MVIKLDVIQTVGLAVLVFLLGRFIKGKVKFFQKYFIPAPVIGGLICSILIFIGVQTKSFTVEMNTVLQDFFMNLFFTGTGFILFPDRKLTWHFEQELRQTRRLSQSIMEIYGQESQRSMAQFLPEGLSDSY